MSVKSKFNRKYQFPFMIGGILLGAYIAFSNRHYLLGDLEPSREILFQDDKEARLLLEEAIKAHKSSS